MRIAFNNSGTHLHKEALKVRLDFYPDQIDKTYSKHYVRVPVIPQTGYPGKVDEMGSPVNQEAYNLWLAGLPHIWQLNPCLSAFVQVDENITPVLLNEFIQDIYKADTLATLDNALIASTPVYPHLSAHLISPYMRNKTKLSTARVTTFDTLAKTTINTRLSGLSIAGKGAGIVEHIEPQSIDVGDAAVDRVTSGNIATLTYVNMGNPANDTGSIDTIETWMTNSSTGCEVASFYVVSGYYLSTRDYESIGSVTAGSKQTFTGLSLDISTADYIGTHATTGRIEFGVDGSGGLYASGDTIPCSNVLYTFVSNNKYVLSLYGTGSETPSVVAPTVTTQSASSVTSSGCTGNGNITATGGENCTRRGFCYLQGTSGDPTTANSVAYDDGSYGTGAFTKSITGLSASTSYRVRAYAVNSAGTGYGSTVDVTTSSTATTITTTAGIKLSTTIDRDFDITKALTSNLSVNPVITKIRGFNKVTSSPLSISPSFSKALTFNRATNSGIRLQPLIIRKIASTRATTSNLSISPVISFLKGKLIAFTTNLSLSPVISRTIEYNRNVITNISLNPIITRSKTYTKAFTTNLSLSTSFIIHKVSHYLIATTVNLAVSAVMNWNVLLAWLHISKPRNRTDIF